MHNGNDVLREWNWKFALRFVTDAEVNSQAYALYMVDMTAASASIIFFVSVVLVFAVSKAEEKKLHALRFFVHVPASEIERLVR